MFQTKTLKGMLFALGMWCGAASVESAIAKGVDQPTIVKNGTIVKTGSFT